LGEGLTAYIARSKKFITFNSYEEINEHESTSNLNTRFDIHDYCTMLIGFALIDEKGNIIGVLKVENYGKGKIYNYTENSPEVEEALKYLPLLVRLIKSSESYFSKNSYEELFKGMNLLENLKIINHPGKINQNIYEDTLHLFFVLKRKEYIGHEEILDRIIEYTNDISKYLDLKEETVSFNKFLNAFKKHEELLLYGLNDYRDHFMHQFHVFISGYIIINQLGIEEFRSRIQDNMNLTGHDDIEISESDVLRIWFLTSFYHDYAYILEKIDDELSKFFEDTLGYRFGVKFNWEQLLKKGSNFPEYISGLIKHFISSDGKTNQGTLLGNYLNAIIENHDHGVLSALLLIEYNSGSTKKRLTESLYAALAISFHNKSIFENLLEGNVKKISFESFPIAFLLAFCDTAQSYGRVEKKGDKELLDYPVKFSNIKVENKKAIYELKYTSKHMKEIPTSDVIDNWAKGIHNVFKAKNFCFEIKHCNEYENEEIITLPFH